MVIRIGTWNLENLCQPEPYAINLGPTTVVDGDVRATGVSDRSAIGNHCLVRGHLKVMWAHVFRPCAYALS